ncbi:ABC transporter ATP-binding protein [Methanocella arvoryzae]|uniref:ABC-type transport system, ATPase component n=1 Tax=Methanocella arvoryzae (strain DSM 22066 / NBRC 105507 / MRE50) TaxID=351160 RepID=Q0W640_METAR|nr:ABC transporter ATP-binding protein [Methanocella arvoryzae]CAJ36153.1 ABC-type transport system, ATPase component [Methanocella arvoryzae MRE50]
MQDSESYCLLKAEGLTKAYESVKVVDAVDLEVKGGEIFGFLGHNGAGKTTTINMMVGLIEPTSGRCLVNGIDVIRKPTEAKKLIGYLPDGVGCYWHMTARQNMKYLSKFYRSREIEGRIDELIKYVGLEGVEKPVGKYSRGMKQRLGLALALLHDPQVLFLDEPTNGLDPEGVLLFRKIIKEQAEAGKAVLLSSHVLEEVRQLCGSIGIISKGKIIARGPIDEVKRSFRPDGNVRVRVKVSGTMPALDTPGIISAVYYVDGAEVVASEDITDRISVELINKGVPVRQLTTVEASLEDVFLGTVYRGV